MAAPEQQDRPRIRDLEHFTLFAPAPNAENRRARLVWGERAGNPRITVFTGDPGDKVQGGTIAAPMDPTTFMTFLDLLGAVASGGEFRSKVDCYTSRRDEATGRQGEKTLLSELHYGRDAAGIVWVSVQAKDRPRIKFTFSISDYHAFYDGAGNKLTEGKASEIAAHATIGALRRAYNQFVGNVRQPNAAGGGNNSGSAPVSTSSASAAPASFDDITF